VKGAYCIHQETLFRVLGFAPENVHALDASEFEGADIVHDLNVPIDETQVGRFDFIFDGGTIEHVFSVKDAMFNTARMCKVGGVVMHISPADYLGHGIYNFSAGLFRDFYPPNGFEEITVLYLGVPIDPRRAARYYLEFSPEGLNFLLRQRYATFVFAVFRKADDRALVVPQQGYYTRLWGEGEAVAKAQWGGRLRSLIPDVVQSLVLSIAPGMVQTIGRRVKMNRARRVTL
jgi:hypothetical protein